MKKKLSMLLAMLMLTLSIAGCGSSVANDEVMLGEPENVMSEKDAVQEMESLLKKVTVNEVTDPKMYIYTDDISEKAALADISAFPIVVQGKGDINIEIAAATELTADAPDDLLIVVAKNFNKSGAEIDGKSVSVSVRKITSGEAFTYIAADAYTPNVLIPSNDIWGKMIASKGIGITTLKEKTIGNTAGILLEENAYKTVKDKYGDITISNVLKADMAGDISFAHTNPFTSSTEINMLAAMLYDFDPSDPLSAKASDALLEYQKTSPVVGYTTAVLRSQAEKGIIDSMVMEEQAYVNTPALSNYEYIPFGVRHDHPVYTFDWNTSEENEAAELFTDFLMNPQSKKLADERGFNRHEDYKSVDTGLTGTEYITAQSLWKQNKSGGKPIIAVFIADTSGSMKGEAIAVLKQSIINTLPYISSEHYVGLVSFASDVTINLPIEQFDDKQRAYFSGEIQDLNAVGGTCSYNALLVGMQMIHDKMEEIPDAEPIIFMLTDGDVDRGYSLRRVTPIVEGLGYPVYCVAYNYERMDELENLSDINEAPTIRADSTDIVNQLRNLFNTQL